MSWAWRASAGWWQAPAAGGSAAHMVAYVEAHVGDYRDGPPRDDTAILVVQVPEPLGR